MSNTMGQLFKVTTFGESHSEAVGCVIDNCPAGIEICEADIQKELDRRKPGQSNITTPRKESDIATIVSGIFEGKTIGTPICVIVKNENAKEKDYAHFKDVFRPSHADYTYAAKFSHRTYRGGGRASARTTIGVVAAGAIAQKLLLQKANVSMVAWVSSIANIAIGDSYILPEQEELLTWRKLIDANDVRCIDSELANKMRELIMQTRKEGDSLGGTIQLKIRNLPPGWGEPVFQKLDALLAAAMLSIPATKGVEIGSGFRGSRLKGSEHNDSFYIKDSKVATKTNLSGGVQGGISNGEDVDVKIAFKPTATINKRQDSVNLSGEQVEIVVQGRHDPCVLPRAVPIVESMAALVLADLFLMSQKDKVDGLRINSFDVSID